MVELLFIDSVRQKVVSSVVINRLTVLDFITGLNQTLINFDKEIASKEFPKAPEIKTTMPQAGIR